MMKMLLHLTIAHMKHHRIRSALLIFAVAMIVAIPIALGILMDQQERELLARAESVPLVVGTKGNRIGTMLNALYFRSDNIGAIPAGLWKQYRSEGRGAAVPIHRRFTASGFPIIGTSGDYYAERRLTLACGVFPERLGEAVAGSVVAANSGLGCDSTIISDPPAIYAVGKNYPVAMTITGILSPSSPSSPSNGPEDRAILTDVHTTWVMEGIGHNHDAYDTVQRYIAIAPENISSFHFHGDPNQFPLSAILLFPKTDRDRTIWRAGRGDAATEVFAPREVAEELLTTVFQIKKIFDAQLAVMGMAATVLFGIILALSFRLRRSEFQIFARLGAPRGISAGLFATESFLIIGTALLLSSLIGWGASHLFRRFLV